MKESATKTEKNNKRKKELIFWAIFVPIAVTILTLRIVFSCCLVFVDGNSMQPNFKDRQICFAANFNYTPKQYDVICFKEPETNRSLIKRVVAVAGDKVYINYKENCVIVNGKKIKDFSLEPMLEYPDVHTMPNPITVPDNSCFVLGDNRNNSLDSRSEKIGTVPYNRIIGKVYT